jgi:putative membrane protein insertion efficiency factor
MLIRLFIRGYQILISPVLSVLAGPGGGCRFEPTCSHYFLQAVETHGSWRGSWLGIRRLCRCHPWGASHCTFGIELVTIFLSTLRPADKCAAL